MAFRKKKVTKDSNKKIIKKKADRVVLPEVQQDVSKNEQTPVSENKVTPSVIPSGVLPDIPKEETSKPGPLAAQPLQQTASADAITSQPTPAISTPSIETSASKVEPIGIVTQNPFTADDVVSDKTEQEQLVEPKKKLSLVLIILIVIGIVFISGVLWYFRENASKQISRDVEITSTPSPSRISPAPATESAKLSIDYSKYKIKVLNGSGIKGAAAKGKEILESEKFIVEEIGNAETSDYDLTTIQAKKEVPKAFLDKLKSILEKTYKIAPSEELEDTEEVDVVIIIGSGKKQ